MRDSLFRRHFIMTAGMILLAFALLSTGFMYLSYRYTLQEKKNALEEEAGYIARLTAQVLDQEAQLTDSDYLACLSVISGIAGSDLLVCSPDGAVLYSYLTSEEREGPTAGSQISGKVMREVLNVEQFEGTSDLGVYDSDRFVVGVPLRLTRGEDLMGVVLITSSMSNLTALWRDQATIFVFTALVVLCAAFVSCTLAGIQQVKPLKEMAEMVRRFGMGEYDLRVTDHGRRDELGELANAFNSMADSIAETENQRREFVANVSHELKTPMTTISGFADGILDGTVPPEKEKDALRVISNETRRLSRLVRRMLDASRTEVRYQTDSCQLRFDIVETMARVMISLEGRITSRGLDIDVQFPDGPTIVWGDPDSVTQVCYNLLDNAIKFSTPGTAIRLSIQTKGRKAYIGVRNIGETIQPEELDKIFDRFHKSDRSRSLDKEGVGLGLYIVKTILNSLKETITVTREDGVTEFAFTLTLAE